MACHLLYHLAPFSERGVWRQCLSELLHHLPRFDGRRVLAVVHGPGLAPLAEVAEALEGAAVELIVTPNEPALREVTTFGLLFGSVESVDHGDSILWAHGKGVQSPHQEATALWRQALHYLYLERMADMLALLQKHPVAGAFKKTGPGWQRRLSASDWHYSGSWCWYRAGALFSRPDWRRIDAFVHGIESYPSLHFRQEQAGCLFWEARCAACNLYSLPYWHQSVSPALQRWKESHPYGT